MKQEENISRKGYVISIIAIMVIAGFGITFVVISDDEPEAVILQGDNFSGSIKVTINKINRYGMPEQDGELVEGQIAPVSSSGEEIDYLYVEDFENSTTEWTTEQWGDLSQKHYEGEQSYKFRPVYYSDYATLTLNKTFNIPENETFDITFYSLIREEFDDGYFSFSFKASWIDEESEYHEVPIRLVMCEDSSNPYLSTNTSEIVLRQNMQQYVWTGFLIQDIRQLLLDNDHITVEDQGISLFDLNFEIDEELHRPLFIDYFKIQTSPTILTNLWFYGSLPITDYQVQIEYEIRVNSTPITSLDEIILRVDVFRLIANDIEEIDQSILDSISLSNLTFVENLEGNSYDKISQGTYQGILHSFPHWNFCM